MPFFIERNDITKVKVDAIVNAANCTLLGGGGVDGAIHFAAGPELVKECATLGGCKTGEAKITKGYNLPAKYVIHTVGPVWCGGEYGEEEKLRNCYRNSLKLAKENGCGSVAFPLISAGVYGYPKNEAIEIAKSEITAFISENDMLVKLIIFEGGPIATGRLSDKIRALLDEKFGGHEICCGCADADLFLDRMDVCEDMDVCSVSLSDMAKPERAKRPARKVMPEIQLDESYFEMITRLIDKTGMTDAQCYHKANVDRKLFNKMKNTPGYRPGKNIIIAFAFALELTVPETEELLKKAGLGLSDSIPFDAICKWCLKEKCYDVNEVNVILYDNDQIQLGNESVA